MLSTMDTSNIISINQEQEEKHQEIVSSHLTHGETQRHQDDFVSMFVKQETSDEEINMFQAKEDSICQLDTGYMAIAQENQAETDFSDGQIKHEETNSFVGKDKQTCRHSQLLTEDVSNIITKD